MNYELNDEDSYSIKKLDFFNQIKKNQIQSIITLEPFFISKCFNSIIYNNLDTIPLVDIIIFIQIIMLSKCLLFLFIICLNLAQQCSVQMLITLHPHLDAFWLHYDRQLTSRDFRPQSFLYQMNQRSSKQIYDSMYDALTENGHSDRRYFTTQIFFFKDWYQSISQDKKIIVKQLLKEGRLQITNSGWVQNDQAVCYYDDIIQQYTVGMNYLYDKFNYVNEIGWSTDSFGHSHSQAALLNQLGIIMQGIQRLDQRYIHFRKNKTLLEFFWQAKSDSNNYTYGGLFTHLRYFVHEFINLRRADIYSMKNEFKAVTQAMQQLYQKKLLFRFLGNDFQQFIPKQFEFLENLMKQLNNDINCKAYYYSNPSEYLIKLKQQSTNLEVREYDFMPNWDDRYWSGYYTTYPLLKKKCKDSSRLLNWFRRDLITAYSLGLIVNLNHYINLLSPIQQTVAIMQHHDGITATSKSYILNQMIQRLENGNRILTEEFKKYRNIGQVIDCHMIENGNNECQIKVPEKSNKITLTVFNSGTTRSDRIELIFQNNVWYKLTQNLTSEMFCFGQKFTNCRLVIQQIFKTGKNEINLMLSSFEQIQSKIVKMSDKQTKYQYRDAVFRIQQANFIYQYNNHIYKIGYYVSNSYGQSNRQFNSWDKYNRVIQKNERASSGFYIMFNNGIIVPYIKPNQLKIFKGSHFIKIILKFSNSIVCTTITINLHEMSILDIQTSFKKNDYVDADYFLKLESDIQSRQSEFFHDANGYLVIKRKLNQRPDYEANFTQFDRINGNTYPVTSFAYITNQQNKFVLSLDRAHGVAIYGNNALLLNLDRTTGEDGKGAGETYTLNQVNIFRQRITITKKNNDIERIFQKEFDQSLQGFYGSVMTFSPLQQNRLPIDHHSYIKYTVAFLNNHSAVFRVQNMHQFSSVELNLFTVPKYLTLQSHNLKLKYIDMTESFLNGIPLKKKYEWIRRRQNLSQVDIYNNKIQNGIVKLQPLQIRSFRLDFESNIQTEYNTQTDIMARYTKFKTLNSTKTQPSSSQNNNNNNNNIPNYQNLPKSLGQFPSYEFNRKTRKNKISHLRNLKKNPLIKLE